MINTTSYIERLNLSQRHKPADPYYIKRDLEMLKCYQDVKQFESMLLRATPSVKQRFELFPIKKSDFRRFD